MITKLVFLSTLCLSTSIFAEEVHFNNAILSPTIGFNEGVQIELTCGGSIAGPATVKLASDGSEVMILKSGESVSASKCEENQ
jgi:hypothetical protein